MATLKDYRRKRDFRKTGEPRGKRSARRESGSLAFVVQKHDARSLHYDFRLELDGVLKSWAIPKGPSDDPADKRLAVMVEDHPLDYADFEGVIPEGEYGGGPVLLWDRGTWEPEGDGDPAGALEKGGLKFILHGEKLRGSWALVRMKKAGENDWLLIKHRDSHATGEGAEALVDRRPESVKSGRTIEEVGAGEQGGGTAPSPADLSGATPAGKPPSDADPALATLVEAVPSGEDWLHEIKYDGYRILARIGKSGVRLLSRNGKDWTTRFGAIADELSNWKVPAILDGEVVVLDSEGRSSFQALQRALKSPRSSELVYYVFDLLWCDGVDLRKAALRDRKRVLRGLCDEHPSDRIRFSDHLTGKGRTFFAQACRRGLEGIVCKKAASTYRGRRTADWLKVKCSRRQELVIGGFTEPSGSRIGFGALLVGYHDDEDRLRYAGRVGTGFTDRQLRAMHERLDRLTRKTPPFHDPPEGREADGVTWVRPELVGEVAFTEWTSDGRLRHPSFQGLREDKKASEVRREEPRASDEGEARTSSHSERGAKASRSRPDATPSRRHTKSNPPGFHGVAISNAEREVFPDAGLTKGDVARYFAEVASHILPFIAERPLSVVRCPKGRQENCFYQKHRTDGMPEEIHAVSIEEDDGRSDYLTVDSPAGLVALVQFGALEIHPWLSRNDRLDRPDQMIFDLDPDEAVDWGEVLGAAHLLRDILGDFGLRSFPKLTGGKGLHVVVPLTRRASFELVKRGARAIAARLRDQNPDKFLLTASKSRRKGRIFIDYLRNGRGATAIAPYSVRARPGAPVAVPVRWDELAPSTSSSHYDLRSVHRRLASLRGDPWADFTSTRQSLTRSLLRELNIDSDR